MEILRTILLFCCLLSSDYVQAQTGDSSVVWLINRTDSIGGYAAVGLPNVPEIISSPYGEALLFSCQDSTALLVNTNPLGSDTAFTIEVYFRPDSTVLAGTNNEQRFLHIRNSANDNRRILLETRMLSNQRWLLDAFIRSEASNLTLVDSNSSFSSSSWHHVAMTYGEGMMKQYVDGALIKSGGVTYLPINASPRTSIGARQDPRSWFNGAIRMIKFTKRVLSPAEFTIPVVKTEKKAELPEKSMLNQNFPNPFNPETRLSFTVVEKEFVLIKVLDLTGREIVTLVNEQKNPGNYTISWNAGAVASGIYFCRLQANPVDGSGNETMSVTRKMLVIK